VSSSIEEQFQPPEWATKDEVIKAAQHYINYWKIEARHRNQQWLDAMQENSRLKAEVERLTKENETRQRDMNLMFQEIKEGREAYQRLHYLYLTAKEGKQP
jgi:hypothetical protein